MEELKSALMEYFLQNEKRKEIIESLQNENLNEKIKGFMDTTKELENRIDKLNESIHEKRKELNQELDRNIENPNHNKTINKLTELNQRSDKNIARRSEKNAENHDISKVSTQEQKYKESDEKLDKLEELTSEGDKSIKGLKQKEVDESTNGLKDKLKEITYDETFLYKFINEIDFNSITNEFQDSNLQIRYMEEACRNVVKELNIQNEQKEMIIKTCVDKLIEKFQDSIWKEKNIARNITFLANSFTDCLPRIIPYRYFNESNLKVMKSRLNNFNIKYMIQLYHNEAINYLIPDLKEQGNKFSNFVFTKVKRQPYAMNERYFHNNEILKKKLKLLAIYVFTDGSIEYNNSRITFYNKSPALINKFVELVRDFVPDAIITINHDKRRPNLLVARFNNKNLVDRLHEISPTYRKKPFQSSLKASDFMQRNIDKYRWKDVSTIKGKGLKVVRDKNGNLISKECIPVEYPPANLPDILKGEEDLINELLRIYADTEGYVGTSLYKEGSDVKPRYRFSRDIGFSVSHPIISNQLEDLLKKVGYTPRKSIDHGCLTRLRIPRTEFKKFRDEIGFTTGVAIREDRAFSGFDKGTALDLNLILSEMKKEKILDFRNLGNNIDEIYASIKNAATIYKQIINDKNISIENKRDTGLKKVAEFICQIQEKFSGINNADQYKDIINSIINTYPKPKYDLSDSEIIESLKKEQMENQNILVRSIVETILDRIKKPNYISIEEDIIKIFTNEKRALTYSDISNLLEANQGTLERNIRRLANLGVIDKIQQYLDGKLVTKWVHGAFRQDIPSTQSSKEVITNFLKENKLNTYSIKALTEILKYREPTIRDSLRVLIKEGKVSRKKVEGHYVYYLA